MKNWIWTDELVAEFQTWYSINKGKFEDHLREFKCLKQEQLSKREKDWLVLCGGKSYPLVVRRLSDGLVFSCGDWVESDRWGKQKIEKFIINGDDIIVEFETCRNPFNKIQKVKESKRDWEIVSLIDVKYKPQTVVTNENKLPMYSLEDYFTKYEKGRWKIHSVRRLSDGEIFCVGDDITWYNGINYGRIERFEISKNNGNMLAVHFSGGVGINNISKAKKKAFTTEDGIEIYENDDKQLWHISPNFDLSYSNSNFLAKQNRKLFKIFSTKEAAEEFIIYNKPCLSVNDVCKLTAIYGVSMVQLEKDVIQLAKSKMDKK